ncbi:Putative cytosolic protein (plasmid) [Borrelia coriaceae ATCC 43381]|uniref:Putative cytosolic protein n=2 Tax=Borrelia coriaceae TaxID=144 RepID=W5T387_9SPIR|nr:Putative cytosolic protein [Borrelia coriaceae ATCC 43381]
MRYLDKIKENTNKKRYENSMLKTKKWLHDLKIEKNFLHKETNF